MTEPQKQLFLVIPIREEDDLLPVVETEGWHTIKDLLRKTATSYNTHWNGNHVLDQDEIPWKVCQDDVNALLASQGRVVVLSDGKYHITDHVTLFTDRDGSVYVAEEDVAALLE